MNAFDVVGLLGAVLIVGLFLLLQLGRVGPQSLAYSVWNGIGALLVIVSLLDRFNLGAFLVDFAWLVVSGFGVVRCLRSRTR